jgi:hypothetical protein
VSTGITKFAQERIAWLAVPLRTAKLFTFIAAWFFRLSLSLFCSTHPHMFANIMHLIMVLPFVTVIAVHLFAGLAPYHVSPQESAIAALA